MLETRSDPLVGTLFPLGERTCRASELDRGTPDREFCAPFGLSRTVVPAAQALELGGVTYDPVRQITVLADGTPFVAAPSMGSTLYCTTATTEDMQTWPDTVADGTD